MQIHVVDVGIVILALGAAVRGYQIGFIRQGISTIMFVAGLVPGSWLSGFAMAHVSGPATPAVGLVVILSVCFMLMTLGEIAAMRLKRAVTQPLVHTLDSGAGSIMSVVTLLLGVWLAGALLTLAPPSSAQTITKQSAIVTMLTSRLPPAAQVLTALNKLIDPNQSPQVFAGREPAPNTTNTLPDPQRSATTLTRVRQSVVKIEGLGCGGIVDGSGFVFAKQLVATNAHVVAGVASPKIQSGDKTYNTTVVVFDPANDLAILRVPGLDVPVLDVDRAYQAVKSPVFALGYPAGGDYKLSPGVILDRFDALGQDIYGKNRVVREVYSLQTTIVRGNSGGPVIDANGTVVGVVFATSTAYNNVGYALTIKQIYPVLSSAPSKTQAVSTGQCSQ